MSVIPELLAANERYAASFTAGGLPPAPARRVAVLTCMDARMDPAKFLGLGDGDANVLRNAGGRVHPDVIRSLVVSYELLGTRELVVVHHTDCGMLGLSNAYMRGRLRARGVDAGRIDFLPFDDLDQSVRDDVDALRASPLIAGDTRIVGLVYDVHSGRLRQVV
ncbi:MAG: carbonic anhydrase [Chloroflexota bacterium]|nr:carbonic anhydrase [Chloroflexota bacterium]